MNLEELKDIQAGWLGTLPASVRYDPNLQDKTKLLYAELTSRLNVTGETQVTNEQLAEVMDVSKRAISRHLALLKDRHHINIRMIENSADRIISIPLQQVSFIQPVNASTEYAISQRDQEFMDMLIGLWEEGVGTKILAPKAYYKLILERLLTFSYKQLIQATKNRIRYVCSTEWYERPENHKHRNNFELLLRDDSKVEAALGLFAEQDEKIKPPSLSHTQGGNINK